MAFPVTAMLVFNIFAVIRTAVAIIQQDQVWTLGFILAFENLLALSKIITKLISCLVFLNRVSRLAKDRTLDFELRKLHSSFVGRQFCVSCQDTFLLTLLISMPAHRSNNMTPLEI